MKWFWIALIVVGGVFAYRQMQQPDAALPAPPEHAQITQMAKQAEAKAQQAAAIASTDTVAEFEKQSE